MDFGSAEEVSVDTAAMGAEVGGGGGANINVIPKSGGNTVKGDVIYSIDRQRLLERLHRQQHHRRPRAQGVTDPTLQKLSDLNARCRRSVHQGQAVVVRIVPQLQHHRGDRLLYRGEPGRQLTNPFDSNLRNYTASGKYQINKNNQLSAFWTYNRKFQPNRGAGVTQPQPDQHAAPGVAEEPDQRATGPR